MAATSPRTALNILSADGNFDAAYKGSRLVNKEMEAPLALPVCLQSREGVVLNRPTQGWTVEEASPRPALGWTVSVCNAPVLKDK